LKVYNTPVNDLRVKLSAGEADVQTHRCAQKIKCVRFMCTVSQILTYNSTWQKKSMRKLVTMKFYF